MRIGLLFIVGLFITTIGYGQTSIKAGDGWTDGKGNGITSDIPYLSTIHYAAKSANESPVWIVKNTVGSHPLRMFTYYNLVCSTLFGSLKDTIIPFNTNLNLPPYSQGLHNYSINVSDSNYNYVIKSMNRFECNSSNTIVFEIKGAVDTVLSIKQSPSVDSVRPGQSITVYANLRDNLPLGQGVYLYYTKNNNTVDDTIVEMTGNGKVYSATIPSGLNTKDAFIKYYVFTSGAGLHINYNDADFYAINYFSPNNSTYLSSNYIYQVYDCKAFFSIPNSTQCLTGNSFSFNNSSTTHINGNTINYQWSFGDGTYSNAINPPSKVYADTGIYTIQLKITSLPDNCIDSTTLGIRLLPNLFPTISIGNSANNICFGTNVNITTTTNASGRYPTYKWYLNGSPVGTNTSTYSNSNLSNNDSIYVTYKSDYTCRSVDTTIKSNTIKMVVYNTTAPKIYSIANKTFCSGTLDTINFTGTAYNYSWTNSNTAIGALANGEGKNMTFTSANSSLIPFNSTVTVLPNNRGSYAYIPNSGSNTVSVINLINNVVVATITVGNGPQTIAISTDGLKAYVVNSTDGTISVINTLTNIVTATISTGTIAKFARGIIISPDGNTLYAANDVVVAGSAISIIDTKTNLVTGSISGFVSNNQVPGQFAISNDGSRLYATIYNTGQVAVINTSTKSLFFVFTVGSGPVGITLSTDGSKCYVACNSRNTVEVYTTLGGTKRGEWQNVSSPLGVAISSDGSSLYVTNYNNSTAGGLSIINTSSFSTVPFFVSTGNYAKGVNLSNDGSLAYVTNEYSNSVTVVNTGLKQVVNTIIVGNGPIALGNFITPTIGCAGSSTYFQIVVNPSVTPDISISADKNTSNVYNGELITFTAVGNNSGSSPTYNWKKNGIIVGTNSTVYKDSVWHNNDIISCTLNSSAGCAIPSAVISNVIAMKVQELVIDSFGQKGSSFCTGSNSLITFYYHSNFLTTKTISNAGIKIIMSDSLGSFNKPDTFSNISLGNIIKNNIDTIYFLNCYLTLQNKNIGYATQYRFKIISTTPYVVSTDNGVDITLRPSPLDMIYPNSLIINNKSVCEGDTIQLGNIAYSGFTYNWTSYPTGFSSNLSNPVYNAGTIQGYNNDFINSALNFYITVTNSYGCTYNGNTNIIQKKAAPVPTINLSVNNTICANAPITLSVNNLYALGDFETSLSNTSCPNGYVATGYIGKTGSFLDNICLRCKLLKDDGTLGSSIVTSSPGLGTGANNTSNPVDATGANDALIGINEKEIYFSSASRSYLVGVQGIAESISDVLNQSSNNSYTMNWLQGTNQPSSQNNRQKNNGFVMTGLSGNVYNNFSNDAYPSYKKLYQKIIANQTIWSNGQTGSSITVNQNDTTVYTAKILSSTGCSNTGFATVNVYPVVQPPAITIAASDTIICVGKAVLFSATTNNVSGFQWKKNGINVGSSQSTYSDNTLNDNDKITCEVTGLTPCFQPVVSNLISIKVSNYVSPTISITASQNTICSNQKDSFMAAVTNEGVSPVYQWKKNGNNVGFNSKYYVDSSLKNNTDSVYCLLKSSVLCPSVNNITSNKITVVVNPLPIKPLITASGSLNLCPNDSITLTAMSSMNNDDINYLSANLKDSLISYYTFTNNFRDTSGRSNHASFNTNYPVIFDTSRFNMPNAAASFIAGSDGLTIAKKVTDDFTFSFWIKTTKTGIYNNTSTYLLDKGFGLISAQQPGTYNDYGITLVDGKIVFGTGNPDVAIQSTNNINDNIWHFVSATRKRNNGQLILYIDGVQVANGVGGKQSLNFPQNILIGQNGLNSVLDDIMIYNRVLTSSEVLNLYNLQSNNFNYTWNTGKIASSISVNSSGYYLVNAMTGLGCSIVSDTIRTTYNQPVFPTISISADKNNQCFGNTTNFSALTTNEGVSPVYFWKKNGMDVGQYKNTYRDTSLLNGDKISCQLQSSAICAVKNISSNIIPMTVNGNVQQLTARIAGLLNATAPFGGNFSGDGGLATNAELNQINKVVEDNEGNVYLSDQANFRIRKIDAKTGIINTIYNTFQRITGIYLDSSKYLYFIEEQQVKKLSLKDTSIVLVAGSGSTGYTGDGGSALLASFNLPQDIVKDKQGNLYIADRQNRRVRKISPNGIITTVAGNGISGYSGDNGLGINANLSGPEALCIDSDNNLYIADKANHTIRKLNLNTNIITTIAGNGTQGNSSDGSIALSPLYIPMGVFVDKNGLMHFSELGSQSIRSVDPNTGKLVTDYHNYNISMGKVTYTPNSSIYIVDGNYKIWKLYSGITDTGSVILTSTLTSVCEGKPVTFTATATNMGATPDYLWKKNGVIVGTNSNVYTDSILKSTDSIFCEVSAAAICLLKNKVVVQAIIPKINKLPLVSINTPALTSICKGDSITLSTKQMYAGQSLKLNGINQNISVGNWFNYQTFTISFWVKPNSTQNQYACILDNNHTGSRSFVLQQNSNSTNQYYFGGSAGAFPSVATFNLIPNTWQHLALVATPTQKMVYLNGVLVASVTGSSIYYDGTQLLRIGQWGGGGRNWGGEIDELRIYNSNLSSQQILSEMNIEVPVSSPNLVSYYKMDDSLNSNILISSTNSYNATLYNNPTFLSSGILMNYNSYLWSNNGLNTKDIVVKSAGSYAVSATNYLGCSATSIPITITEKPSISGNVITGLNKKIPGVSTFIKGNVNQNNPFNGFYYFDCIPVGSNEILSLFKNNDKNKSNGVSTIDAALVQSHILQKSILNNPYKIIAADLNGDGKVSALDIVFIKRLILGLDTTFTKTTTGEKRLWAFVDSSYQFPDTINPFPYKDSISFTGLSASKSSQTFIGMKLGDVNWDWNPAIAKPNNNTANAVELSYESIKEEKGNLVSIPIKINNFKEMMGMQFTLGFNAEAMTFKGIEHNLLNIEMGTNHLADGKISMLWLDTKNEVKTMEDGTVAFELVFKNKGKEAIGREAIGIQNTLSLDGSITTIEAFDKDFQLHGIVMKPSLITISEITHESWVVAPNPTTDGVIHVQMNLKEHKTIVFHLVDRTGKVILSKKLEGEKGMNNFTLRPQSHLQEGIYYLKADGVEGVKQIRIKD